MTFLTLKNLSVLLLVAVMLFPVGINPSYAQTLNKFLVTGTDSTDPIAPDHTIEVLIATETARVVTLPFSTFVSDATDNFDALAITFSIRDNDVNELFRDYVGTNATDATHIDNDHVALVLSEPVTIRSSLGDGDTADIFIDYTVVNTDGGSSSGVITLKFTHAVGDITVNPHTITLDNLFGLPVVATPFANAEITGTLLSGSTLGARVLTVLTLTIGASDQTTPGTLTYVPIFTDVAANPPVIIPATFTYTPNPGFEGTETFAYTIDIGGKTDTSQIIFIVPALVCDTSPDMGADFGTIDPGEESPESPVTITNSGNSNVQVMMSGAQWLSGIDDTTPVMNVDVTKWSLTAGESYAAKTGLVTTGGADIPTIDSALGADPLNVYLQLAITLLDQTFRGPTTQALTVSTTCE